MEFILPDSITKIWLWQRKSLVACASGKRELQERAFSKSQILCWAPVMHAKDDSWDNKSNRLNLPLSLAHDSGFRLRLAVDPLHNHGHEVCSYIKAKLEKRKSKINEMPHKPRSEKNPKSGNAKWLRGSVETLKSIRMVYSSSPSGLIPSPSEQCLLNVFPKFSSRC